MSTVLRHIPNVLHWALTLATIWGAEAFLEVDTQPSGIVILCFTFIIFALIGLVAFGEWLGRQR